MPIYFVLSMRVLLSPKGKANQRGRPPEPTLKRAPFYNACLGRSGGRGQRRRAWDQGSGVKRFLKTSLRIPPPGMVRRRLPLRPGQGFGGGAYDLSGTGGLELARQRTPLNFLAL